MAMEKLGDIHPDRTPDVEGKLSEDCNCRDPADRIRKKRAADCNTPSTAIDLLDDDVSHRLAKKASK